MFARFPAQQSIRPSTRDEADSSARVPDGEPGPTLAFVLAQVIFWVGLGVALSSALA